MESELGPGDMNAISRVVSSIDPQKVDKTGGRWQWPHMCLPIKPAHSFHQNQKSFIVSAVQNIS